MTRSAHIIEVIAQAQAHEVCAQLRLVLSSEKVRAAAPLELTSERGRFEAGLREVVKALQDYRPRPRTRGPLCHIAHLPAQRLEVVDHQLAAAAWHLDRADELYWVAAYASSDLLTSHRLRQLGGEPKDARQDGLAALHLAARRYDHAKGKGRWRRHAISWLMLCARDRAIARYQGALTTYGYELRSKAHKLQDQAAAMGCELSHQELADELGSTPEYIARILDAAPPSSLDAPVQDVGGVKTTRCQADYLEDKQQEHAQGEEEARLDMESLLARMPPREAWVLARLFGLWGTTACKPARVALELDYPESAIERLRSRAMRFARGLLTNSRALGPAGVLVLRAALQAVDSETPGEDPSTCAPEVQALVQLVAPKLMHATKPSQPAGLPTVTLDAPAAPPASRTPRPARSPRTPPLARTSPPERRTA